jgi:hypothetical protein
VAGAAWFWFQLPKLRLVIRPIYQKLGILPVVVDGEN